MDDRPALDSAKMAEAAERALVHLEGARTVFLRWQEAMARAGNASPALVAEVENVRRVLEDALARYAALYRKHCEAAAAASVGERWEN